jgi:L-ascorbate metabolism protein UlaG (beta-lactamase superfamily)
MEISFLGAGSVRITGKDIAIISDPPAKNMGLADVKSNNDVTLLTQMPDGAIAKSGMTIDGPGEYEVKGAMITGVPSQLHTDETGLNGTAYSVAFEGVNIAILGNVAPELKNDQIEALGQVDVLVIPVGNHGLTLDSTSAAKIISQLEPKYVVPTHYDDGKTRYEVPQDKLEVFLKEIGTATPETQAKLRVTAKDLPLETQVVVLQPQS